jgi:1-acyl-sn-glycerol-3-phosphate acyltransferase
VSVEEPKRPKRRRKGWVEEQSPFLYRVAVMLVGLLVRFWVRKYRAIGAEKVPSSGGAFLVANHTSGMDPFLLGYPVSQRPLRGPGKVGLFANPFFGYIMRRIGIFPVRQGVADAGAVRTMVGLYRAGGIVIVYPEGARSETGELRPFMPEFARLVIRLRAPLVPAAIAGAGELLPIGKRIPRFGIPVVVVYGDPFDLSAFYDRPLTLELTQEAADVIREHVAGLLDVARQERQMLLAARA